MIGITTIPFKSHIHSRLFLEGVFLLLSVSRNRIMSSCVTPTVQDTANPIVLLHGFDSSCLEWRYTLPLLEQAGLETWAIDILGWGFNKLETLPHCTVESKGDHLFQLNDLQVFTVVRVIFQLCEEMPCISAGGVALLSEVKRINLSVWSSYIIYIYIMHAHC